MNDDGVVVTYGELLLRLGAPGAQTLLQTPQLEVHVGGAEANVAVALARLGRAARHVSVIPDNPLGRAALEQLRRHGVDVSRISLGDGRMGLYFLSPGAIRRPSEVIYDRADSAFARSAGQVDWADAFAQAGWFHISGVTAALGPGAALAAIEAVKCARRAGLTVSFDCNYRPKLWGAWDGDGAGTMFEIARHADLLFGDHRDFSLMLVRAFEGPAPQVQALAAEAMFEALPRLRRIACTHRLQHSVDHHDLTGMLFTRGDRFSTAPVALWPIVDRIGGGDAFAAGLIHGLSQKWTDQTALDFAVAAAALKHATPGDFSLADEAQVFEAISAESLDVKR